MNFADASAFLALLYGHDRNHKEAVQWPTLERPVLSRNLVLAELAKLLAWRLGYTVAAGLITDLYRSPSIDIAASRRDDEIQAIVQMRKFADQDIGFTDCVSFAIMRRYKICTAFCFDRHFRLVGFHVIGLK